MCHKIFPLILIIVNFRNYKKFKLFCKYICINLFVRSILKLSNKLKTLLLSHSTIANEIGFTHKIIFYKKKNKNFLQILKNPRGPSVIFLIVKFGIKKKNDFVNKLSFHLNSSFLLLNNFIWSKRSCVIYKIIQQLFPSIKFKYNSLYKAYKTVLVDFNLNEKNHIEIRLYQVKSMPVLLPRIFRKNKNLTNFTKIINPEKTCTNISDNQKRASLVKITELGPRITIKTVDVCVDLK
nr:Brix-domain-containing protein [Cryptomonas paramecium]